MRHRKKSDKLSRSRAQRKSLLKCLVRSFFIHERIKTTPRKAKATSSKAERLISLGKRGDLASRRLAYAFLQDHRLVKKLFDDIGPRYAQRPGGYTRIVKVGHRVGDDASVAILELVEKRVEVKEEPKKKK